MNYNLIKPVLPEFSDALQTKCVRWAAMTVNFHVYYQCHEVILNDMQRSDIGRAAGARVAAADCQQLSRSECQEAC